MSPLSRCFETSPYDLKVGTVHYRTTGFNCLKKKKLRWEGTLKNVQLFLQRLYRIHWGIELSTGDFNSETQCRSATWLCFMWREFFLMTSGNYASLSPSPWSLLNLTQDGKEGETHLYVVYTPYWSLLIEQRGKPDSVRR